MLDEQFPIIAGPERPAVQLHVLKHGDCFGVFDPRGNIVPGDASEEGIFHDGTRFLSWFELLLFGNRPLVPLTFVSAAAVRLAAAAAATWVPARRALRVDPIAALRAD